MTTNKINAAESIRGLACLAVVLSHLSLTFFPQLHNFGVGGVPKYAFFEQIHHSPFAFFYSGTGAVFVFFVLSGYVLSLSSLNKPNPADRLKKSLIKRYPRLAIPAFLSCIISYLVCYFSIDVSHVSDWGAALAKTGFHLKDAMYEGSIGAFLFGGASYNWVLWTMQIELFGSLMIYFASYFYTKSHLLTGGFILLCLVLANHVSETMLLGILSFVLGMALFLYGKELKLPVSIALFLFGLYCCGVHDSSTSYQFFTQVLDGQAYDYLNFIGGFCVVYAVLKGQWLAQIFDRQIFVFLGKVSFSIYLLHLSILYVLGIPFFNLLYQNLNCSYLISGLAACLFTVIVSIGLAQLYSRYVDEAAIKVSNRLAKLF